MTNDEIRKLPVVNPDDLATQHVCVPVGDLARLLSDSDRATDGLLRFGSCSEEDGELHRWAVAVDGVRYVIGVNSDRRATPESEFYWEECSSETEGFAPTPEAAEEAARAHDVARRAAPNYRRARQWGED